MILADLVFAEFRHCSGNPAKRCYLLYFPKNKRACQQSFHSFLHSKSQGFSTSYPQPGIISLFHPTNFFRRSLANNGIFNIGLLAHAFGIQHYIPTHRASFRLRIFRCFIWLRYAFRIHTANPIRTPGARLKIKITGSQNMLKFVRKSKKISITKRNFSYP